MTSTGGRGGEHLLIRGDARRLPIRSGSVHCCVTSPPYWGLRDYQTARWEGGDPDCSHVCGGQVQDSKAPRAITLGVRPGCDASRCKVCGARRVDRQIGLEESPEAFVTTMVAVFREVWRVLRDDGTVWLNLGDSYSGSGMTGGTNSIEGSNKRKARMFHGNRRDTVAGLKPKDLVGIPWRVALALQHDGWYLRSDIIWSKPNPMPESITDRPTKSHEYLFLLAKGERYYYDADAIREPNTSGTIERLSSGPVQALRDGQKLQAYRTDRRADGYHEADGRNRRSVWTVPTTPFPGAHFATFPPKLISPCIKAGTSEAGCCPACGRGWERVVERTPISEIAVGLSNPLPKKRAREAMGLQGSKSGLSASNSHNDSTPQSPIIRTLGWQAACNCNAGDPRPAVVLDPFSGAGTTGVVSLALGRSYVGLDLNPDYLAMSRRRIERPHAPVERPAVAGSFPLFASMEEPA